MKPAGRSRLFSVICFIIAAGIAVFAWSLMFKNKTEIGAGILCIAAAIAYLGIRLWSKECDVTDDASDADDNAAVSSADGVGGKVSRIPENKRNYQSKYHEETFAVAGVSFRNDNGTSRQKILERMLEEEGLCCAIEAELEEYLYEGEPAIRVNTEYGCVGNIRRSDIKKVQAIRDEHASVVRTLITPSEFYDEEEDKTVYRADVALMWLKSE